MAYIAQRAATVLLDEEGLVLGVVYVMAAQAFNFPVIKIRALGLEIRKRFITGGADGIRDVNRMVVAEVGREE